MSVHTVRCHSNLQLNVTAYKYMDASSVFNMFFHSFISLTSRT